MTVHMSKDLACCVERFPSPPSSPFRPANTVFVPSLGGSMWKTRLGRQGSMQTLSDVVDVLSAAWWRWLTRLTCAWLGDHDTPMAHER